MVFRHPGVVANETRKRLAAKDAKSFERVSLVIGTLIGTPLIAAMFLMDPLEWNSWNRHNLLKWTPYSDWPVYVLTDSLWSLPILAVSLYVAAWLSMACYRWMMQVGMRGIEKRRCGQGMRYASAIWPVEAMLLGRLG